MTPKHHSLIAMVAIGIVGFPAYAQMTHYTEYVKTITEASNVKPLDMNLFGDEVNLYTGSTQFAVTDVDLPGNSRLRVAIGRIFNVEDKTGSYGPANPGGHQLGDWELDIPYLTGVFARGTGWVANYVDQQGQMHSSAQRCTQNAWQYAKPPILGDAQTGSTGFSADEYWHGNHLHIPGIGNQEMMLVHTGTGTAPQNGGPFYWVTKDQWFFSCLPSTANSISGEAFMAIAPDGTKYRFDWIVRFAQTRSEKPHGMPWFGWSSSINAPTNGTLENMKRAPIASTDKTMMIANFAFMNRDEVRIYPTQVEDRFGNRVVYTYDLAKPKRLLRIEGFTHTGASDGRKIELQYDASGLISSIQSGTQGWIYTYGGGVLTDVRLPDHSYWHYAFAGLGAAYIQPPMLDGGSTCETNPMNESQSDVEGTVTHPSGAIGTFRFTPTLHGRSNAPASGDNCVMGLLDDGFNSYPVWVSRIPQLFGAVSIREKKITGPGLQQPLVWQFDYEPAVNCGLGGACPNTKWVKVTGPDKWERHTFSNRIWESEGVQTKYEVGALGSGTPSSVKTTSYVVNASGMPFPARIGISPFGRGDRASERHVPAQKVETVQDGLTFKWQVNSGCAGATLCFDQLARPTSITKSSGPTP